MCDAHDGVKGYRLWNLLKIVVSRDVVFNEEEKPFKKKQVSDECGYVGLQNLK